MRHWSPIENPQSKIQNDSPRRPQGGILFGCHWCPHQCLRSRAAHPPCRTGPQSKIPNRKSKMTHPVARKEAFFLGATGAPTSVFDRERPIRRAPPVPNRKSPIENPKWLTPSPARRHSFWVPLVPPPVSSIASGPSSVRHGSPIENPQSKIQNDSPPPSAQSRPPHPPPHPQTAAVNDDPRGLCNCQRSAKPGNIRVRRGAVYRNYRSKLVLRATNGTPGMLLNVTQCY